jgi:REP element-mobilizing transposase RayT
MVAKCEELGCEVKAVGGIENHVHLLVRLSNTVAVGDLMREVKACSSLAMNETTAPDRSFRWQGAYAAFSVPPQSLGTVTDYILSQRERHLLGKTIAELEAIYNDELPQK